jgi:hypothetical protein
VIVGWFVDAAQPPLTPPRPTGMIAAVMRAMHTSRPSSSSIRIDHTWLVRPRASARAVA